MVKFNEIRTFFSSILLPSSLPRPFSLNDAGSCRAQLPLHSLSYMEHAGYGMRQAPYGKNTHLIIAVKDYVAMHRHKGMKGGCVNILTVPYS